MKNYRTISYFAIFSAVAVLLSNFLPDTIPVTILAGYVVPIGLALILQSSWMKLDPDFISASIPLLSLAILFVINVSLTDLIASAGTSLQVNMRSFLFFLSAYFPLLLMFPIGYTRNNRVRIGISLLMVFPTVLSISIRLYFFPEFISAFTTRTDIIIIEIARSFIYLLFGIPLFSYGHRIREN